MLRLAIIEDNEEYRNTLSKILQRNEEIQMIFEAGDCKEMIPRFEVDLPSVVIMDIDLPGISVIEDPEKIFGAIKAGANGYLLKKDPPDRIMEAIFSLKDGQSIMNGIIAAKVLEFFKKKADAVPNLNDYNITEKEKVILNKLMQGLGYKQIAHECFISKETLNSHIKNIYRKLDVHSRGEVAAKFGSLLDN